MSRLPIKFIHTADSHIGFTAYNATDDSGINQREIDAMLAFKSVIDHALSTKPNFILHAGDLFHTISPNNRAISFVLTQLQRIEDAKIHMYITAGNHETPKRSETGHVFETFEIFEYIHTAYPKETSDSHFIIKGMMNTHQKEDLDISICMLPHCIHEEQVKETIKVIQEPGKFAQINILVTHGTSRNIAEFKKNEFNEQDLPDDLLTNPKFNYIALGHYHNYTDVTNIATYSGSTFPLTFGEIKDPKGFLEISIDSTGQLTKEFILIESRPVIISDDIDATNKTTTQIQELINFTLENSLKDSVIRLKVNNITPAVHKGLDFNIIRNLSSIFLHCDIQYTYSTTNSTEETTTEIGPLNTELEQYLNDNIPTGPNKALLIQKSLNYLKEATEIE